ncbi:unnamed protein product [Litomosoides sigmodontis]|uniref:Ribosomal RNA-processing protein 14/surfeit locus protein 6 C-terminal domain-containing protein n=1 Tax=Litomosoides sigmodontis TaxID=42156 RepID=A0A3P6THP7_LITSI|nr:unnamed protein product [Litomosoides sigmodontis]
MNMHISQSRISSGYVAVQRTAVIIGIGIGVGVAIAGYFSIKRFWRSRAAEKLANGFIVPQTADFTTLRIGKTGGVTSLGSSQRNLSKSSNIPAAESDILSSLQSMQEILQRIERAAIALDMVKNRSEKDYKRSELLSSVLDRVVQEGGYEKEILSNDETFWSTGGSHRAGTLSVLSDDSFWSAYEELPVSIDNADVLMREPLNLDKDALHFYQQGVIAAEAGEVNCRKIRTEFCCCENDDDFKAKVWCIRQAFTEILLDEHNRVWLSQAGRQLIADLLRHASKNPSPFYLAYDAMMEYLNETEHLEIVDKELKQKGVRELGFWDVVLDYILIDAFEDLSRPPSALLAVTRNVFLNQTMKESTLVTVIWSMLKAKRAKLSVPDGFVSHFYDISETTSPSITLGFLGTDEHLRELCHYFKEQMCSFIVDIFNVKKVRYTSVKDLAEDVRLILETPTMLSKDDKKKMLEKCLEIDKIIKTNIDLIPIGNWQFDDETIEKLREQKHRIVDEHLTGAQKQKLSNASKQRLAREMGVNCQKITDVLDWMEKNCNNTRPVEPAVVFKQRKLKETRNIKPENSKSMRFEASSDKNPSKSSTEVLNESIVNATACTSSNRKRIRDDITDVGNSSSVVATSIAPADVLEGRKLALKKLQEKLEQFKAKRRGKMSAYEYEEKRKLKRRMSKLKMKQRRADAKQQTKNSKVSSDDAVPMKHPKLEGELQPRKMGGKDEQLVFSKFDFIVRDEKKKETKKDKRDKFTGKDYKRLLEKAEKREERLEQMRSKNPEKALRVEKNIQWNKALRRAEGQKVKDNPELLKKSLKKKEKMKEWRKKKWAGRVEHVLQMQARKQEKRLANIQARKDIIKKRKMQKARKKGRIL